MIFNTLVALRLHLMQEKHHHAALTILKYPSLEVVENGVTQEITFDYISGLLTFREGAPLMSLFRKTSQDIDLIVFHSHGQSHPRKFGLASHLGFF